MRGLLETTVLRSIDLATVDVAAMEAANARLAALDPEVSIEEYRAANHEFHFLLFACSPLTLVVQEVRRMWTLSEFYRSLYMHEPGAADRVVHDHAGMIDAVRARDLEALIAISDAHRDGTETSMARVLGPLSGPGR
jgi:DNA-binding GntR family transcriptional regulator